MRLLLHLYRALLVARRRKPRARDVPSENGTAFPLQWNVVSTLNVGK
jgi:hypothetical protein